jgi:hypothetical protein
VSRSRSSSLSSGSSWDSLTFLRRALRKRRAPLAAPMSLAKASGCAPSIQSLREQVKVLESEAELKEALLSGDPWLLQVPSHHHVSCADSMRLRDRQCVNETTPVFAVTADAKKLLLASSDVKVAALNCHKQERACCTLPCLQPSALHARRTRTRRQPLGALLVCAQMMPSGKTFFERFRSAWLYGVQRSDAYRGWGYPGVDRAACVALWHNRT